MLLVIFKLKSDHLLFFLLRIPGDYRNFNYCTAIRHGGISEFDFASSQYDKGNDAEQRQYLQKGMSCTTYPSLVYKYLNDQINSTKVFLYFQ